VIPAAIEAPGGVVEHFGMPVDPGNLLLLGRLGGGAGARRAGLRAFARGERLRLGVAAPARRRAGDAADIRRMGVGGLLMEIVSRPQRRRRRLTR
jgi:molybdenum cofactor cytidylyltransferase